LSKDEFSLRVGQVIASRTYADLGALTADIPGWVTSAQPSAGPSREFGCETAVDRYEAAYLCGGPRRVALTAVVTLHQDGRIKISPARHRVVVIRDEASDPVERAVLDAAPWPGMGLGFVLAEVAGSAAVDSAGDELRRRGLLGRHSHLTAAGRELRDELQENVAEDLRIAVVGTSGVDSGLRKVLEAPDPPSGSTLVPKRRDKGEHVYGGHHSGPRSPGTRGFPAAGELAHSASGRKAAISAGGGPGCRTPSRWVLRVIAT
jgi:hypothetical protein